MILSNSIIVYYPTVYYPTGYYPAGYCPVGFYPAGYYPAGFYTGYYLAGYCPAGYYPTGTIQQDIIQQDEQTHSVSFRTLFPKLLFNLCGVYCGGTLFLAPSGFSPRKKTKLSHIFGQQTFTGWKIFPEAQAGVKTQKVTSLLMKDLGLVLIENQRIVYVVGNFSHLWEAGRGLGEA